MKNKKRMAITAVLSVAVITASSLAIFAAEPAAVDAETVETEAAAVIVEETEAEPAVSEAETVETETAAAIVEETEAEPEAADAEAFETEAAAAIAEETEAEPAVSDAEAVETEAAAVIAEETEAEPAVSDADYSYHVGQQSSTARNDAYAALPEGGTKEDAEGFYETYGVGGGAWTDGVYDESLKSGYGYAQGQQRAAQYAQDGDDDEEYKAGYSYSTGRQSYMENYPNYTK